MIRRRVLVDAGPIVALVRTHEQYHDLCAREAVRLRPPLYTCWPVVAEAAWLRRDDQPGLSAMFDMFRDGRLKLLNLDESAMPAIHSIMERYASLPAQLADATLVYLAEREGISTVFTLDRRDISVYRFGSNRAFTLLPAELSHRG